MKSQRGAHRRLRQLAFDHVGEEFEAAARHDLVHRHDAGDEWFFRRRLGRQAALERSDVLLHALGEPHHFLAARRQRVARSVALEQSRAEPMLDLSEFSKHG